MVHFWQRIINHCNCHRLSYCLSLNALILFVQCEKDYLACKHMFSITCETYIESWKMIVFILLFYISLLHFLICRIH